MKPSEKIKEIVLKKESEFINPTSDTNMGLYTMRLLNGIVDYLDEEWEKTICHCVPPYFCNKCRG